MTVHFTLKRRGYGYRDIYEAIKTGRKTSEWRDGGAFWLSRLFTKYARESVKKQIREMPGSVLYIPPDYHKHTTARFVVGYTSYPRLIADIHNIYYHKSTNQFEIQITNVREELR